MQIGKRIRQIRLQKGMTINSLAEKSGLSKGFISQVENDKASLSLDNLEKIANVLDVPVSNLVHQIGLPPEVIRREATRFVRQGAGPEMSMISSPASQQLQVLLVELPAGYQAGDYQHCHKGEEVLHMVHGRVRATQGEDFEAILEEGDTLHWDATVPHTCINIGEDIALFFVAVAPPALPPVNKSGK